MLLANILTAKRECWPSCLDTQTYKQNTVYNQFEATVLVVSVLLNNVPNLIYLISQRNFVWPIKTTSLAH